MAEVQWIKIYTNMFDISRKIKSIEQMPQSDTILIVWFKLLLLAGKVNDGGAIYVTPSIPFGLAGLSYELRRPPELVEKALSIFEDFDMIERDNGFIYISSWEEYQNIEGMEKIREQNRLAQQRSRARRKQLQNKNNNNNDVSSDMSCDSHVTVMQSHGVDKEEDKDIKNKIIEKENKEKEIRHKYGEYSNVLLSDSDYEKLKSEFPSDYTTRIENLSSYIASTGKSYKNHLATIRNWAKKDASSPNKPTKSRYGDFDAEEAFQKALKRSYGPEMHKSENTKTAANDPYVRERMEALKEKIGQGG